MKIHAQSLASIRQAMVSTRALLSVTLNESGGTPERRRIIKRRIQDLTAAMRLLDDSLGTTTIDPRGAPESWRDANTQEEANDG